MSIYLKKSFLDKIGYDPTKESVTMSIQSICQNVEDNKILLPIFQTGLRWTTQKVIDLLNFQLTGFAPVSPISMCKLDFGYERSAELVSKLGKQIKLIERETLYDLKGEIYSLTDGQQRVSTNYKCYIGHADYDNILLDLSKGRFVKSDYPVLPKEGQIPVGVLYNKDMSVFISYLDNHSEFSDRTISNYITAIRNKFMGYNYTIHFAKNLSEKQQLEWFEILNNAGSKIPGKEMELAKLKVKDIDFHKEYIENFLDLIDKYNFENCFPSEPTKTTYPLSALNPGYDYFFATERASNMSPTPSDVQITKLCSLNVEELKRLFTYTLEALEKVLKLIDSHPNISENIKRMEYITFGLGYYVFNDNTLSPEQEGFLLNWFQNTKFVNKSNTDKRLIYQKLIGRK